MKIKNLLVFGDSFPAGLNKDEHGTHNSLEEQNKICFGTQMNRYIDIENVWNYGFAGRSNLAIAHDVLQHVSTHGFQDSFVIICWTGLFRDSKWNDEKQKFEATEYTEQPDYLKEVFNSRAYILNTYDLLKKLNVDFLFTSSFLDYKETLLGTYLKGCRENWIEWEKPNNTLFNIASNTFCAKTNTTFIGKLKDQMYLNTGDYYKSNSDGINICSHPNRVGHRKIAIKLTQYIKNYYDGERLQ